MTEMQELFIPPSDTTIGYLLTKELHTSIAIFNQAVDELKIADNHTFLFADIPKGKRSVVTVPNPY